MTTAEASEAPGATWSAATPRRRVEPRRPGQQWLGRSPSRRSGRSGRRRDRAPRGARMASRAAGLLALFLGCVHCSWSLGCRGSSARRSRSAHRVAPLARLTVVLLVVTHVALMIVGGALLDQTLLWSEVPLSWRAAVSLAGADRDVPLPRRRRLERPAGPPCPLERDLVPLDLTIYVGIFLAFFHEVAGGTHFVANQPRASRGPPVRRDGRSHPDLARVPAAGRPRWHGIRVSAVVPEASGLASVWLTGSDLERLDAGPASTSCSGS